MMVVAQEDMALQPNEMERGCEWSMCTYLNNF